MKIYLDNCCFNRPFDDQLQLRIRLESEAKLQIQENISTGIYKLIWSYILDYENSKNPFKERQKQIAKWSLYSFVNIEENDNIINNAININKLGVKNIDSLHIACAYVAKADYFITTDDGILNKSQLIQNIRIIDPIGFIKEVL